MDSLQGLDINQNIPRQIALLNHAIVDELKQLLQPYDLTPAQWSVLEPLYEGKANTPAGLAEVIGIDGAAITRSLDRLEKKGFTKRITSTTDRRSVIIDLTSRGKEVAPPIKHAMDQYNSKLTIRLGGRDIDLLKRLVSNISGEIYEYDKIQKAPSLKGKFKRKRSQLFISKLPGKRFRH